MRKYSRRSWTAAEDDYLRRRFADTACRVLALKLDRGVAGVYSRAHNLGLSKGFPRLDPKLIAKIPKLHAKGLTDQAIADQIGIERRYVSRLRRDKFHLPVNAEAVRDAARRGVQKQLKTLGLSSPTQLRTRAFRLYAAENGWPEDLRPREVQILNALATHGPMTRAQISARIGMRSRLSSPANGRLPLYLTGNGPGGSYTASLLHRGFICYVHRSQKTGRRGHGRMAGLYMLTATALEMIAKRTGNATKGEAS